jgi:single-strand DNA-binding protein
MSNEIDVTVKGWLAWEPKLTETTRGIPQVRFRVGSTPRRRDAVTGQWNDGPTEWFDVIAYRDLAHNAALSLRKGTPVVVRGRLEFRQWDHEGKPYSTNRIVADAIGVELSRGAATYRRTVTSSGERPGAVDAGGGVRAPETVVGVAEEDDDAFGYEAELTSEDLPFAGDPSRPVDLSAFEVIEETEPDAEELARPA